MFSLMCAVVDDCSSLDARTCWMQASILSALPMIASSAPPPCRTAPCPARPGRRRATSRDGALHLALIVLDHLGDLARRLRGAFGQPLHFLRDDGEGAAVAAGAGRLDGGVEGEQLRLVGDLLDDARDRADLLAAAAERCDGARGDADGGHDLVHAREGIAHDATALVRLHPERCAISDASAMLVLLADTVCAICDAAPATSSVWLICSSAPRDSSFVSAWI
jgi:hypothetical protein